MSGAKFAARMKLKQIYTRRMGSWPVQTGMVLAGIGIHSGLAMHSCLAPESYTARLAGATTHLPSTAVSGAPVLIRGMDTTSAPATIAALRVHMLPERVQYTPVLVSALAGGSTADAANKLLSVLRRRSFMRAPFFIFISKSLQRRFRRLYWSERRSARDFQGTTIEPLAFRSVQQLPILTAEQNVFQH